MRTHVVIPDTQAKPGVPVDHLGWIGQYIVEQFRGRDVEIIHLGDHADMPSLSSYDKGRKAMEGRRIDDDIDAANYAFSVLCEPIERAEAEDIKLCRQRHKPLSEAWRPPKRILLGNHEDRISRACEADAQLDGLLTLDALNYAEHGWTVHPFLEPVEVDGVMYAHYFYNPMTGRPYAGQNLETRLKNIGLSFTMGHQQGLKWGRVDTIRGPHIGLVAGSCYLHDEDYKGPQGNDHWRGIIVCHEVRHGSYDPMFVSLDYLCRRYEGVGLHKYTARRF